jgi:hypothetical protein
MLIAYAVAIAIVLGFLTGGGVSGISQVRLRYPWLLFAALFVQIAIFSQLLGQYAFIHRVGPYIHIATLLTTLFVMWQNAHIPGMKVIMLGAALNLIVIAANGGFMPATRSALEESGRIEILEPDEQRAAGDRPVLSNSRIKNDDTNLWWLGDVWAVPDRLPASNVYSIGDVVLAIGAGIAIVRVMHLGKGPRAEGRRLRGVESRSEVSSGAE